MILFLFGAAKLVTQSAVNYGVRLHFPAMEVATKVTGVALFIIIGINNLVGVCV